MNYERVPTELRELPQWVGARIVPSVKRPGKTDKYPIAPKTGHLAETNNAATWGTFAEAVARMKSDNLDALGFVFTSADPYTGIDLDDVMGANEEMEQWARYYVHLLQSYAERSQSGKGVHVIVRAVLPPGGRKAGQVEMYDAGRFFVFTGDVLDDYTEIRDAQDAVNQIHAWTFPDKQAQTAPTRQATQPVDLSDVELLAKARAARNGATFDALMNGSTQGYPSASEADMALCGQLAFWTGGDAGRMDTLFRSSALYRPEKWNKPHHADGATYGEHTIAIAIQNAPHFYDGNGRQPPDMALTHEYAPEPPAWMPAEPDYMQDAPLPPTVSAEREPARPRVQPKTAAKATAPRVTGWSAAELLATDFPEPVYAVPGIVPVGLTILGGRPKVGKSWLALQIAIAVGTGGMALDHRVQQGNVLYLALEDNGRRLKERTTKQGMPASARIQFVPEWPRLTNGGFDALDKAIAEHGYTLVIIDTLGRLVGKARTDDYGDMTDLLGALQDLAMTHDMAILALDHHRKSAPGTVSDPVDDIVGSTAKSGAADALLGLSKEQGKRGATLKVTGRDVEWQDLALSWDAITCCWQYEGTTEEVAQQGNRERVITALRDSEEPLTATKLAESAGIGRSHIHPILNELVNDGTVERLPKVGKEVPYRLR